MLNSMCERILFYKKRDECTLGRKQEVNRKKKKDVYWIIFFVFAGSTMIAHGARMMFQGLFRPFSVYPAPLPSTLDFWFDWMILALLGCILFSYGLYTFHQQTKQRSSQYDSTAYLHCIT